MDDMALGRLMRALGNPLLRSLVLAPGREAAVLHVRPGAQRGWVFTLECRPVLAGLLGAAATRAGSALPTELSRRPRDDGQERVQLELEVRELPLARRVLEVFLRDHTRTRPHQRLSAFVLDEGEPVARLLELYRPAPARSASHPTLVVLPAVVHATS
jgi:hypothetical protein